MALCISRRPGENLVINGNIVIKVVQISGKQVRIDIEAPQNVPIVRGELLKKKKDDK